MGVGCSVIEVLCGCSGGRSIGGTGSWGSLVSILSSSEGRMVSGLGLGSG